MCLWGRDSVLIFRYDTHKPEESREAMELLQKQGFDYGFLCFEYEGNKKIISGPFLRMFPLIYVGVEGIEEFIRAAKKKAIERLAKDLKLCLEKKG